MRFHARVGILPHERELPQPLEIDLTVWLRPGAPADGDVLDYRDLYSLVASAVDEEPRFLEELADAIASGALRSTRVHRARAAVRKPQVALGGPLDHAEVVIELDRA